MITRNILRRWFVRQNGNLDCAARAFDRMTDEDLALEYGLTVLRKGWFS